MKKSTLILQPAEKLWYIGYHDIQQSSWRAVAQPVLVHWAVAVLSAVPRLVVQQVLDFRFLL